MINTKHCTFWQLIDSFGYLIVFVRDDGAGEECAFRGLCLDVHTVHLKHFCVSAHRVITALLSFVATRNPIFFFFFLTIFSD